MEKPLLVLFFSAPSVWLAVLLGKRSIYIAAVNVDFNTNIKRVNMKRIISLIILLGMLFTLAACGGRSKCKVCHGSGYYQKKTCVFCNGTGYSDYDPYEHYKNVFD